MKRARPIRVGVSACLLGQKVRYDGGHKRDRYITDTLGEYFEWVPVCPEVEIGLGTPRPTIRLEIHSGDTRLVMPAQDRDLTKTMTDYSRRRVRELAQLDISGYILKSNSPSCGMERVPLFRTRGRPSRRGRGLFAAHLLAAFPHLPVVEEQALADERLRANWLQRVFAYHDLRRLWESRWTMNSLRRFHARYELVLRAHSPDAARKLQRLISEERRRSRQQLRAAYTAAFMQGLGRLATRRRHAAVLQDVWQVLEPWLTAAERRALLSRIQNFARGRAPLSGALALAAGHVRALDLPSLRDQAYFDVRPAELAARG